MPCRIIPARAGFTLLELFVLAGFTGSSPLARGLLKHVRVHNRSTGIIPARAGFTASAFTSSAAFTDHPRSRGVYVIGWNRKDASRWIIPARAGFTMKNCAISLWVWDHPRSRGVYVGGLIRFSPYNGSSPLARGLPPGGRRRTGRTGIIPARAGFTTTVTDGRR